MGTNQKSNRKRELVKLYDSTAHIYNKRYRRIQYRKYKHIGNIFTKAGNTLDVGCGTGLLLCLLGVRAGLRVGVDTSAKMLRIASNEMKRRIVKGDLIRADADSLPFRDNVFASVTSVTVLQNLSEPRRAISEIARVATWGGRIALSCLKKKYDIAELERIVSSAASDLEITSDWDNNEEDIGLNASKLIQKSY
jgi:ubiquinone/menaquinone biosynthesis C-methylase UbiE